MSSVKPPLDYLLLTRQRKKVAWTTYCIENCQCSSHTKSIHLDHEGALNTIATRYNADSRRESISIDMEMSRTDSNGALTKPYYVVTLCPTMSGHSGSRFPWENMSPQQQINIPLACSFPPTYVSGSFVVNFGSSVSPNYLNATAFLLDSQALDSVFTSESLSRYC